MKRGTRNIFKLEYAGSIKLFTAGKEHLVYIEANNECYYFPKPNFKLFLNQKSFEISPVWIWGSLTNLFTHLDSFRSFIQIQNVVLQKPDKS